ncbi:MAG: hypothetical protein AAFY97_03690, partial [Pseudomonadota bacterium]
VVEPSVVHIQTLGPSAQTGGLFMGYDPLTPNGNGSGWVYQHTDRDTGEVMYGEVPPYSVVVAGSMPSKNGINLYCAVIVKRVDERTRSKTGINELLRD